MTQETTGEDWRSVLDHDDAAALAAYSRKRPPLGWSEPILLVIDVTERFVGPDVPVLEAQRTSRQACGERAWRAIPGIADLIGAFRRQALPIVFTVPDPLQTWVGAATRGAVSDDEGTVGAGVIDEVRPMGDLVVVKTKASAFGGTPLVNGLISTGRRTVVICGGTTSGCVRATATDATSLGFETVVAADACFDRVRLSHLVALADLDAKYASVLDTADIVTALDAAG